MRVPSHSIACATLAGMLSAVVSGPVAAADAVSAMACHAPTALQSRLLAKADEGVDVLRNFVFSRRHILRVDMNDVGASLDKWRAGAQCMRQAQQKNEAAQVVAMLEK